LLRLKLVLNSQAIAIPLDRTLEVQMKNKKLVLGVFAFFFAGLAQAEVNIFHCESKDEGSKKVTIDYTTSSMTGDPHFTYTGPSLFDKHDAITKSVTRRAEVNRSITASGEIVSIVSETSPLENNHSTSVTVALYIPVIIGVPLNDKPFEFHTLATGVQHENWLTARLIGPQGKILQPTELDCTATRGTF
jgi:hypothetical protein